MIEVMDGIEATRRRRLPAQGRAPRGTRRGHPGGGRPDPRSASLGEREHEVLVAIGQGWTNTETAERLVLTESTVKKHVGRVLAEIGARDRIQAVIAAYDAGLVRPQS